MEEWLRDDLAPDGADTILIADDDEINRAILGNIFTEDYRIEEARDGQEALEMILRGGHRICAVVLDIVMPRVDGLEVLERLNRLGFTDRIPVFLVTAETDSTILRDAYSMGAMDVIAKPIVPYIVERRINSVIELFMARKRLDAKVEAQRNKIYRQERRIAELNVGMIEALSASIEFRSGESGSHVRRIRGITERILMATEMGEGLSPQSIHQIGLAAVTHDVGKIAIPDSILNKPARLTAEEYSVMKTHTIEGWKLLENIPQMRDTSTYHYATDIALHHHERWDGGGYPDGLAGDQISAWAQVVSIADVYDALVNKRVYKPACPPDRAVEMILDGACGVFSPKLLRCFLQVEKEFRVLERSN